MAAGTSLGEGIGLQQGRNKSDYWIRRLADDQDRERQQKAKEEELIKQTDFKIDYGKYFPKYGRAIADEQRKFYAKVAQYRQQNNGNIPYSVAQQYALEAKEIIGGLEMSNANAKRYVEGTGFKKDAELARAFTSSEGSLADLKKYNRGNFIAIGDMGEFSYLTIPDTDVGVKYDEKDRVGEYTGKIKRQGNLEIHELKFATSPDEIKQKADQLMANKLFVDQVLFDNGAEIAPQPGESEEDHRNRALAVVAREALNKATVYAPPSYMGHTRATPYRPPAGSTDKRVRPTISENTSATIVSKNATTTITKNGKAESTVPDKKDATITRPLDAAVSEAKGSTLSISSDMIDAQTNTALEGTGAFFFKPDRVVSVFRPRDKKYHAMVLGTAYTAEGGEAGFTYGEGGTKKTFQIMTPLSTVASNIDAKYDLSEFNEKLTELNKKEYKVKPVNKTTITFTINGVPYEGSQDQIDQYRKDNPKDTVVIIK